jgi:hypothetical protein
LETRIDKKDKVKLLKALKASQTHGREDIREYYNTKELLNNQPIIISLYCFHIIYMPTKGLNINLRIRTIGRIIEND